MAARSLATVVANIRSELNRGTDFDTRITEAIQNCLGFFRARRYGFNVKRVDFQVSTEYVTLPDDFLEVDRLRLDLSAAYDLLIERTPEFVQRRSSPSYTSTPVYFAFERNGDTRQLRFVPAPDQTYSCELVYIFDTAESVSWTDSLALAWFDEGYNVVKNYALAEVLGSFIGDDEAAARAGRHMAAALAFEKELRRQANMERHSDGIRPVM